MTSYDWLFLVSALVLMVGLALRRRPRHVCPGCGTRHRPARPCPDGTRWWQGPVVCRVCCYRWQAVVPIPPGASRADYDLECPNCEYMAGEPEA